MTLINQQPLLLDLELYSNYKRRDKDNDSDAILDAVECCVILYNSSVQKFLYWLNIRKQIDIIDFVSDERK